MLQLITAEQKREYDSDSLARFKEILLSQLNNKIKKAEGNELKVSVPLLLQDTDPLEARQEIYRQKEVNVLHFLQDNLLSAGYEVAYCDATPNDYLIVSW